MAALSRVACHNVVGLQPTPPFRSHGGSRERNFRSRPVPAAPLRTAVHQQLITRAHIHRIAGNRRGLPLRCLRVTMGAGGAGVADFPGEEKQSVQPHGPKALQMAFVEMRKGFGSFGGVTLEKAKIDFSMQTAKTPPQTDIGGGGGGIGNKNSNGGGDGGDDGGDDDDYFDEGDDDEGGDDGWFSGRVVIPELFDRETIEAVLQEWFKTILDLPAGLRLAVELKLVSGAQLARFLSMDCRPTVARAVARTCPDSISRAFIGRMIADPAFLTKLAFEQAITITQAVLYECGARGERLKDEWDLALMNVVGMSACNAMVVWATTPCRSFGNSFTFPWESYTQHLPNNIFDKDYPLRKFETIHRIGGFAVKSAELCATGVLTGGVIGALQNAMLNVRRGVDPSYTPSLAVPSIATSALGYGAFMGLAGNLRYQIVGGVDRIMHQHFANLTIAELLVGAMRGANVWWGNPLRNALLRFEHSGPYKRRQQKPNPAREWLSKLLATPQTGSKSKAERAAKQEGAAKSKSKSRYRVRKRSELMRSMASANLAWQATAWC